jgi:hypothetical protein
MLIPIESHVSLSKRCGLRVISCFMAYEYSLDRHFSFCRGGLRSLGPSSAIHVKEKIS